MLRKTIGKRMAAKLKDIQQKLRQRRHASIGQIARKWLISAVRGYFQYQAVPTTRSDCGRFAATCCACGAPASAAEPAEPLDAERFQERLGVQLPIVETLHPWPDERFAARHPR